ncbi:MAG: biotin-dependent carboxyltransferase [Alphaproteobacteria bacterium]|nr:biotin-dependent carboxyltransferase [Alphaproteobacteria bacterium]
MIEILKPGLETTVQDWPGRKGHYNVGFPPCGALDSVSLRLANLLVGNSLNAAGLECQFIGPHLRFTQDAIIALCGADMGATLDGTPLALWQSHAVRAGQVLALGSATLGARTYVAIAGGIDVPPFLGSRATYTLAHVGGFEGRALKNGDRLPIGPAGEARAGRAVKPACRPVIERGRATIEVVVGPNDDWIDEAGQARFFVTEWRLSARSNRVGFRLEGPDWTFTRKAYDKAPENGNEPSNTIDHGYAIGAINLGGQTPIILMNDALTLGGFINPYTVISAAFAKLAQTRPGDRLRFVALEVEAAQDLRRAQDRLCGEESLS